MGLSVERMPSRVLREALLAAAALAVGLLVLPLLVWLSGTFVLGRYPGGAWRLWLDFLALLGRGSTAAWILLLGPYVLLLAFRALREFSRRPGG